MQSLLARTEQKGDGRQARDSLCHQPTAAEPEHAGIDAVADPDSPAFHFGTVVLLREAVLPLQLLDRQVSQEHEGAVHDLLRLEQELTPLTETLTTALYLAIPGMEKTTRRKALALRRDIHALRLPQTPVEAHAIVHQCDVPQDALLRWLKLANERDELLAASRRNFRQAQTAAQDELIDDALSRSQFRTGLRLTSPGVFQRIPHLRRSEKKARQFRRKLLRFIVRAATSAAPLNGFATISLAHHGRGASGHATVIKPSQEVLHQIATARSRAEKRYCLNDTVVWSDEGCTFLGARQSRTAWFRRYENRRFRLAAPLASVLRRLPAGQGVSGGELMASLVREGLEETKIAALLDTLVTAGLLVTDTVDGMASDGLELAGQLAALRLTALADLVQGTARDSRFVASQTTVHERAPSHAAVRSEVQLAVPVQSAHPPDPSEEDCTALVEALAAAQASADLRRSCVYATVWQPSPVTDEFMGQLRDGPLRRFVQALPRYLAVNPVYARLLDDFLRRYGKGGTCVSLLEWLRDVDVDGSQSPVTARTSGLLTAPFAATLYVDWRMREHALELHCENIYCHVGWQLGRFAFGHHETARALQTAIREELTAWAAPARPVTFCIDADLISLQANPALFEPVIAMPGHAASRRACVKLDRIRVRHEVETNQLLLFDGMQQIRPVYNGGSVPMARFGLSFLLAVLAEPFQLAPRSTELEMPHRREVHRRAPQYVEGVLVAAGAWWIPMEILAPSLGLTGFDRFASVRRIWKTCDIDLRAWACGCRSERDGASSVRSSTSVAKWFDVRSDACIDDLARLMDYEWVVLFDALSPEALRGGGRGHVTSLCTETFFPRVSCALGT